MGEEGNGLLGFGFEKSITNIIICFPAVKGEQLHPKQTALTGGSTPIQLSPPSTPQTKSRKLLLLPPRRACVPWWYLNGLWILQTRSALARFQWHCLIWNFPYCHSFLSQSAQEGGEGRSRIKGTDFSLCQSQLPGIFQGLWGWAVDVVSHGKDELLLCFTSLHAWSSTRPSFILEGWEWHHRSKCSGSLNLWPERARFIPKVPSSLPPLTSHLASWW